MLFVFCAKFREHLWASLFINFIRNKVVSPTKLPDLDDRCSTYTMMGSWKIWITLTESRKTDTNKGIVNAQPISLHTTFPSYPSFHFSDRGHHDDIWLTAATWWQHGKVKGWATSLLETRYTLSHPVTLQYTHLCQCWLTAIGSETLWGEEMAHCLWTRGQISMRSYTV